MTTFSGLSGNFASIDDELSTENLPVKGQIPSDLTGIYMRNGVNPEFVPNSYIYGFDVGDGMIHAIYLRDGKATYRNRYIQTKELLQERAANHALYGGVNSPFPPTTDFKKLGLNISQRPYDVPLKAGASICIINHAGKFLAMSEPAICYEINKNLETIGPWQVNGSKPTCFSPHTKRDPSTGELFLHGYYPYPPYWVYYRLDKNGKLLKATPIDKPSCTHTHDFALTQRYVAFFESPLHINLDDCIERGEPLLKWHHELGTRIGIAPRVNPNHEIRWFQLEPFAVFHIVNAFDFINDKNEEVVIIHYIWHKEAHITQTAGKGLVKTPSLYRTTINLTTNQVQNEQCDDLFCESPKINDNYLSLPNRFAYAQAINDNHLNLKLNVYRLGLRAGLLPYPPPASYNALVKYDLTTNDKQILDFGKNKAVDEAVFVPRLQSPASASEDDGYLMCYVYDKDTDNSKFVILDAKTMSKEPIAEISLPRRVPHGTHGSWFACDW